MSKRIESIAVGSAIVAVSVAVGLILWSGLGVNRSYAALAAIAAAGGLVLLASRTRRTTADAETLRRLAAVEKALRRIDARFLDLSARITEIEQKATETGRTTVRAVSSELDSLGSVIRNLAETVALHDAELAASRGLPTPPKAPADETRVLAERGSRTAETARRSAPVSQKSPSAAPQDTPAAAVSGSAFADPGTAIPAPAPARPNPPVHSDTVVRAIVGERLALFLQPVVGLVSRDVQLYELLGRVARPGQAGHVQSNEVAAVAARHGLLGRLETILVQDGLRVAQHLRLRGRNVPVLVPVSLPTIADPFLYDTLENTFRGNPDLATAIVLQVSHDQWQQIGGLEQEALEAIRRLGVRFALADVQDLRLDVGSLVRRGVRYARASAETLLAAAEGNVPSDIHPHDVPGLLVRNGIEMIVTGIKHERTLAELFEFGLNLGQGELFSAPRAVRPDVLASPPDRQPEPLSPPAGAPKVTAETIVEKPETTSSRRSLRSALRGGGA